MRTPLPFASICRIISSSRGENKKYLKPPPSFVSIVQGNYPPVVNDHISPSTASMFESMIFRLSHLVGYAICCRFHWRLYISPRNEALSSAKFRHLLLEQKFTKQVTNLSPTVQPHGKINRDSDNYITICVHVENIFQKTKQ